MRQLNEPCGITTPLGFLGFRFLSCTVAGRRRTPITKILKTFETMYYLLQSGETLE